MVKGVKCQNVKMYMSTILFYLTEKLFKYSEINLFYVLLLNILYIGTKSSILFLVLVRVVHSSIFNFNLITHWASIAHRGLSLRVPIWSNYALNCFENKMAACRITNLSLFVSREWNHLVCYRQIKWTCTYFIIIDVCFNNQTN